MISLLEIYERDKAICHLCESYVAFRLATRDHILPKRLFHPNYSPLGYPTPYGWNHRSNLALAHLKCNNRRGAMSVEEYKELLKLPKSERKLARKKRHRELTPPPDSIPLFLKNEE